jgi:RimJ/RimL family protein N-acetyltransferase
LTWCLEQRGNIRIDTHDDNLPMQRALEKNGFVPCGRIWCEDGTPRIAYQRTLPQKAGSAS